jgi:lipopolysaccharide/colanic/teichoic acid biosynthesis glycosyltransferase
MSIVGPRPIVFDEIPLYGVDIDFYFCARPGLTGAWQVNGRSNESYEQRVSLDRVMSRSGHWGRICELLRRRSRCAARDAY